MKQLYILRQALLIEFDIDELAKYGNSKEAIEAGCFEIVSVVDLDMSAVDGSLNMDNEQLDEFKKSIIGNAKEILEG